ncbi:universal stress protein [Thermodesulforhabdus norvegica]|uniref:Universal stress protein family protein n=1 Tax=Thermodesulforhabdus norvegica TaxID=39841 RepID=A0A1I4SWR7_9BACT|nr:hypothetical protein [Thermodesulforhabdus norvegica]SFM68906.1 hypothetical protein SAMN05660836_01208 [Thermodesulforhabdus norvegica]
MRILFVADQHEYSLYALDELTHVAENTFSDVTMLGILPRQLIPKRGCKGGLFDLGFEHPLIDALERYRQRFMEHWKPEECPYRDNDFRYEWFCVEEGHYEQIKVCRGRLKDLRVKIRFGQPVAEVLSAVDEEGVSLVVLGCTYGPECLWQDDPAFPRKLVNTLPCSVLLVKEKEPINEIHACLDESTITQESLELVNQMAVIHNAKLNIIALTKGGGVKRDVYAWFDEIYGYYRNRGLDVSSSFTEIDDFEKFITERVQNGLLALWMGKKSLLDRLFQRDSIEHFIGTSRTSVLVLR